MTFNSNLGDNSGRASGGGGGGMGGGFGGGGGGGGNFLLALLASRLGARFGIPGMLIVGGLVFFLTGGFGGFGGGHQQSGTTQQGGRGDLSHCKTYQDANKYDDCRIQGTATALDKFWEQALPAERGIQYTEPKVRINGGKQRTGCGVADPGQSGPFYCPGDQTVYADTPFFQELKQLGGSNGSFSQMYVVAHEFGHHIQKLEGNLGLSNYNDPGENSNAVKIELQADCYAGLWASHADKGQGAVLDPVTQEQVDQAVQSAQAIGDDAIQKSSGQEVNPDQWTHGSAQQRVDSFLRGYQGGTMDSCQQQFNR
ncbi:KPN_02809 family neutral zinc metallopeptidase [Corynebacterium heidelbergense]|uniref:Metalloprotease n=1 Tax=Corynebacterium heidelbergense TaxID=2055947 RepID=A0A364V4M7_9CORY|nr:neutral zinc metallopeptidase [Corynebacterium heidelbergense]RAV31594.1 metalloprotease [Corynebacterium heidelbergense]